MGRRKKKKRRRYQILMKRDPILGPSKGSQNEQQDRPSLRHGEPLNPRTMLQLQQSVGNRQTRQLISQNGTKTDLIQRDGSKTKGYLRDKPPTPWGQFERPQAPSRRGRKRKRPPISESGVKQSSPQGSGQAGKPVFTNPKGSGAIMSADTFKKKTTLKILGFKYIIKKKWKRTGKSDEKFAAWVEQLKRYHTMGGASVEARVDFIRDFLETLGPWRSSPTVGGASTRKKHVKKLISQLTTEVDSLYLDLAKQGWDQYQAQKSDNSRANAAFLQEVLYRLKGRTVFDQKKHMYYTGYRDQSSMFSEMADFENMIDDEVDKELFKTESTSDWFTDQEEHFSKDDVTGGELNRLDYVEYRFKLGKHGEHFSKDAVEDDDPSKLKGLYKKKIYEDIEHHKHRGRHHDMPVTSPGHHRRTVAMSKLDHLLGTDVIPPTFFAKHKDKVGSFMQKVISEQNAQNRMEYKKTPEFEDSVSKLYLLDVIAGQVDRHGQNFLIEVKNGIIQGVKGIDLDLAFPEGYTGQTLIDWKKNFTAMDDPRKFTAKEKLKHRKDVSDQRSGKIAGKLPFELKNLNQKTVKRVLELSESGEQLIRDTLQGFVNEAEIDATLDRLRVLAEILKPVIEHADGHVVSKK